MSHGGSGPGVTVSGDLVAHGLDGRRDGRLAFLTGEREAVIAAAVEAVGDQVA